MFALQYARHGSWRTFEVDLNGSVKLEGRGTQEYSHHGRGGDRTAHEGPLVRRGAATSPAVQTL